MREKCVCDKKKEERKTTKDFGDGMRGQNLKKYKGKLKIICTSLDEGKL